MAGNHDVQDKPREAMRLSPLQRLLLRGEGIPMPLDVASEELVLFTPEERRELARGNAEQCEANR